MNQSMVHEGIDANAGASYEQRGGDQKSPQSMGRPPAVSPRQRRRSPKAMKAMKHLQ
jgi:hypothetical protein